MVIRRSVISMYVLYLGRRCEVRLPLDIDLVRLQVSLLIYPRQENIIEMDRVPVSAKLTAAPNRWATGPIMSEESSTKQAARQFSSRDPSCFRRPSLANVVTYRTQPQILSLRRPASFFGLTVIGRIGCPDPGLRLLDLYVSAK